MKIIFLLSAIGIFSTFTYSQNPNYNQQIGFDATGFLSQFLNFGGSGSNSSPYYVTFRKLGEKKNIRYGIGGELDLQFTNERSSNSIDFRAGKERFNDFGKKWRAFYGWDFKLGLDMILNTNTTNVVNLRLGAAPFGGLQFRLNERISFATEMAYNLWLVNVFRGDETNTSITTEYLPPLSIFIQYDFFRTKKVKKNSP